MTTNTLTNVTAQNKEFYDRNLLMRAKENLVFHGFGQQRSLPKRNGGSISFRRFNALSKVTTQTSEGITPVGAAASVTEVTVSVGCYGNFVNYTDKIDYLALDPFVTEMTDVLGQNGGESVDEITRNELVTGTSVLYATGAARSAQSAANPITSDLVGKAVRNLRANNCKPYQGTSGKNGMGGMYIGVIHPYVFDSLIGDSTVEQTFQYSDPQKLYNYELPVYKGVAWYISTIAPVFAGEGSGGADVYGTIIFGKEAYGVPNIAATGKMISIIKPIGSAGSDDPLDQRGSIAWKSWQAPKILNNNFMTRIECGAPA